MERNKYILDINDNDIFNEKILFSDKKAKTRITVKAIIRKDNLFGFVTNDVSGLIFLAGGGADSEDLEIEVIREVREETL
jgi:8-oxo-dGTP pyrophosphatase MutT (NUDIX family)